jgi:UDP-glucose 4-epimerase
MSDATVLVTGGHGAMGSWVCRELARRGARVVVLDLASAPRVALPGGPATESVTGDVRDTALVRELIASHGVTRLVHLAAMVFEPCEHDPVTAFEVNALATARLLELARAVGLERVVANSTKGTLGPLPERYLHPAYEPVPVDHPPSPRSIYETSKYAVERLVVRARERGLEAVALRFSTTWGPGKSGATHGSLGFHSDIVTAAMAGTSSRVDIHPDQGFDLVYYADVAAGIADACLGQGSLARPVYHVGAGRITTMGEFAATVEAAFPGVRVELGERMPGGRNCLLDIGPATADLGYAPRYDVARALDDMRVIAA